ncbi:MAG: hypothetical protein HUK40_24255 [Desulfobacter sp.]|nr:hypothetical protein [Desulfobacter sp.]
MEIHPLISQGAANKLDFAMMLEKTLIRPARIAQNYETSLFMHGDAPDGPDFGAGLKKILKQDAGHAKYKDQALSLIQQMDAVHGKT